MYWYLFYVVAYFCFMYGMGFYFYKKVKTSSAFLIAGWDTGFWSLVGAHISTNVGAAVFIGWLGMGFTGGISGYFKFALPAYIVTLILFVFFARPLRRQKLFTIADLFSERFGGNAGLIPSFMSAFAYSVPTTALQMVGMAGAFSLAFNIDFQYAIALSCVLILSFTILGGLPATLITEAIQAVMLFVGIIVLLVAVIIDGGGITKAFSKVPVNFFSPAGPDGIRDVLMFALSVGPFYLIWQSTWQRIFAARTERIAKSAGVTATLMLLVFTTIPFLIGMMASTFVPPDMSPDLVFAYLTTDLLPPPVGGIVLLGLLAALMTGATSFILQGSSNLTQDIYRRLLNPSASEKSMMFMSRFTIVIMAALAIIVAYNATGIIALYQWALRLSSAMLVFPFFAVMFWKGATKAGTLWSMVIAALVTVTWPMFNSTLDPVIVGLPASLLSMVILSKLTRHADDEQIRAVYWHDLDSAQRTS